MTSSEIVRLWYVAASNKVTVEQAGVNASDTFNELE